MNTKVKTTNFEKLILWLEEHIVAVLVVLGFVSVIGLFKYLHYWDAIGLLVLNLGLGVKLHGAKTFAVAVSKSGGKKALAMTTAGVLLKRHLIDVASKFFAEHSVGRYKANFITIVKMKLQDIKNSTPFQKMKAVGSTLLSIPVIYFFWTKVLGTAIQKFLYALVYPLFASFFSIIAQSFSFITGLIGFIFQLTLLNYLINWMERRPAGRAIINWVVTLVGFFGDVLNMFNKVFMMVGLDPKHRLIMYSIKLNRWLERIINKGLNARGKILQRREIHLTSREMLLIKRKARKEVEKETLHKKAKTFFDERVLGKKDWRKVREERKSKKDKKNDTRRKRIKGRI